APITDLALNMLEKIENTDKDYITYFSTNKKGEPLKSTTIAIRGEKRRIIGLLCMNLYMNTSLNDFVKTLVPQTPGLLGQPAMENFADNSDELIESTLRSIRERVMNDSSIAPSNKNKMIVMGLDDYGIFNIKDAVIKVANLLDISKNTVYMHLRNKQNSK
ncbi:helix-turn-helix transcriptional regulator, partial [Holdemania filiformis]